MNNQRGLNQAPSPNCPTSGAELYCRTRKNPQNQIRFPMKLGTQIRAKMEEDSTARAHKKQRRIDMRGAQYADATQQPSAMINRRVPDKTHTRQPAPELRGVHTGANGRHVPDPPPRGHMAPISAPAQAPQRAPAPRAHPPPWASSPGRFRASPASPGDGSVAEVVSRRFHCVHFQPMAALLARNPLRIHPETFHFPY